MAVPPKDDTRLWFTARAMRPKLGEGSHAHSRTATLHCCILRGGAMKGNTAVGRAVAQRAPQRGPHAPRSPTVALIAYRGHH
jgi:hypothetical protein